MKQALVSLVVSILAHGLLALVLVAYLEYAPAPAALPVLDVSSVEVSFAEQEAETAPAQSALAAPPASSEWRPMPAPLPLPEPAKAKAHPPEPAELKLEEPCPEVTMVAPRQARIEAPPRPKRAIRPDYPRGARLRGEEGDVVLTIRVNEEGAAEDVRVDVSSGFAELDEAAVEAVRDARFVPARSGERTVSSSVALRLSFRLK